VEPSTTEAVTRLFATFEAELQNGPQADEDLDPETLRALQALGYLD
jgi:hypothetical protein